MKQAAWVLPNLDMVDAWVNTNSAELIEGLSGKVACHVTQEAEYTEQFQSMQQAAGVASNLDLVEACVNAETTNFELFQEVARLNQEAARQQEAVSLLERQTGKLRSATG